jgi:hypothetical protein
MSPGHVALPWVISASNVVTTCNAVTVIDELIARYAAQTIGGHRPHRVDPSRWRLGFASDVPTPVGDRVAEPRPPDRA